MGARSLLDLGAGDGTLTRLLSPFFQHILAVDKNSKFERSLRLIPNVTAAIARMEEFVPPQKVDMILMSYSTSGVQGARLGPFLASLFDHLTPHGKILLATYQDGCAWDRFAGEVYGRLGIPRTGGEDRHRAQIEEVGLHAERVAALDTFIWAPALPALVDTLEFFFLPRINDYRALREELVGTLEPFAEPLPGGEVGIKVVEVVLELLRT